MPSRPPVTKCRSSWLACSPVMGPSWSAACWLELRRAPRSHPTVCSPPALSPSTMMSSKSAMWVRDSRTLQGLTDRGHVLQSTTTSATLAMWVRGFPSPAEWRLSTRGSHCELCGPEQGAAAATLEPDSSSCCSSTICGAEEVKGWALWKGVVFRQQLDASSVRAAVPARAACLVSRMSLTPLRFQTFTVSSATVIRRCCWGSTITWLMAVPLQVGSRV